MPLREEIQKVEAGEKVRPPREWFNAMLRQVRRQYPKFSIERLNRITAGVWHKYPKATKLTLLRRYQKERKGNPNGNPNHHGMKVNGKLYSSLRRSWIGYKIAIKDHDKERANEYARIINLIRDARGEIPLEFTELQKMRRI
jgi:hypothetical protein